VSEADLPGGPPFGRKMGAELGQITRRKHLFALPCRLSGAPLISSTVKNVEDICAAARLAIVDEILSRGETLHTGSDIACRLTSIWVLSKQPETLGDSID
jgi:hypothetical protein